MPRRLVLVTGAPGAGKSTLAPALAELLDFPLLMKDSIKEALHDALGPANPSLEDSRRLGAATYEVIWAVAASMPRVVIECNIHPDSARAREQVLRLDPHPIEVYCRCPPELAAARYRQRHAGGRRHAVHVLAEISLDQARRFDRPLALGPVVEVDTASPVSVETVARRVEQLLAARR